MNRNFAGSVGTGGSQPQAVDPLLSDKEVAAIFVCGRSTVWRWASEGTIPQPLKIGGMSRWPQSWIMDVVNTAKAEATAA